MVTDDTLCTCISECLQIKVKLSTKVSGGGGEEGGEGGAEGGGGGGAEMVATSEPVDTQAVDELKRAFELVETASPGLSDLILQKVVQHLQRRWVGVRVSLCAVQL